MLNHQLRFCRRRTSSSWIPIMGHSDWSLLPRILSKANRALCINLYTRLLHQTILSNTRVWRMIHVSRSLSHSLCSHKKSASVKRLLRYSGRVERANVNGGHRRPFPYVIANVIWPPLLDSAVLLRVKSYQYPRHERGTPLRRGARAVSNFDNVTYDLRGEEKADMRE